jgi:D-alanyl-D-alanine carboxypeptidase
MAEMVLKVSRGEVVIPPQTRKSRPKIVLEKRAATRKTRNRPSIGQALPPIPGVTGTLNGSERATPAGMKKASYRALVLPELRLPRNGASVPAKAAKSKRHVSSASKRKKPRRKPRLPRVRAKALYCVDCSSKKVMLAENISEPLPIASITKLLTAMVVIDRMNLNRILTVPADIRKVPRHRVGLRPRDKLTTKDVLHGMLIESGNDCAEVLARAYPRGGRRGFLEAMNRKALRIGATSTKIYTPSGLDMLVTLGRKESRDLLARKPNTASAKDVAVIAQAAFQYPLIRRIAGMKRHTMRTCNAKPRKYNLFTNDKLLSRKLPVAGAKTGYTNLAGRCIVALFKDQDKEHMVVVLNTRRHFNAAEKIYRWASKAF